MGNVATTSPGTDAGYTGPGTTLGWDDLPQDVHMEVVGFLEPSRTLCFAMTYSSCRVAVHAVHGGTVL